MGLDSEHLLHEVSNLMHLPLKLDQKTHRSVLRDRSSQHDYLIEFPPKNPFIYFYTVIWSTGNGELENADFLRSILGLNLFGLQIDSCTIGIDHAGKNFIMHMHFPLEFITPQLFVNLLKNFISTARKVRMKIEDISVATTREIRRKLTHYSVAENINKKKPGDSMRVIRI
jgi:hypothetical protein